MPNSNVEKGSSTETDPGKEDVIGGSSHDADSESTEQASGSPLKLIYDAASKTDVVVVSVSLVSAVIGGALMPLMTIVFGKMTGEFQTITTSSSSSGGDSYGGGSYGGRLDTFTLYFVYLAIAEFVTVYVTTVGLTLAGERISCTLRTRYLSAVLSHGVAALADTPNARGEVSLRLSSDAELVRTALTSKLGRAVSAMSTVVTAFVVGFVFSWRLALVLSSTLVAFVLIVGIASGSIVKYTGQGAAAEGAAATVASEALAGVRQVAANCAQEAVAGRYAARLLDARRPGVAGKVAGALMMAAVTGVMLLAYALAFWQGSRFLVAGVLSLADVLIVLLAVLLGTVSLGLSGPDAQGVGAGLAAAARIHSAASPPPSPPPAQAQPQTPQPQPHGREGGVSGVVSSGHMQFRDVDFHYPSRPDVGVLSGFSLDVAANKTTAVVGPSGSGKSTLVSLLERFYSPSAGSITLDGAPLQSLDVRWLRRQLALVGQEAMLFDATVFENIAHGLVGSAWEHENDEVKRERVRRAAETANAHGFVEMLPQGYDTRVGERGALLSGGQKQRICIARAIVADPKILLLDEATSALDPVSERQVQHALRTAMQGRTNLVIAHRLSTIKDADCIAVMADGRIVEQGSYADLVERRGAFHRLLEAQSLAVQEPETGAADAVPPAAADDAKLESPPASDAENAPDDEHDSTPPRPATRFISALRAHDRPMLLVSMVFSVLCGCLSTAQSVVLSACIAAFGKNAYNHARLRHDVDFWAAMMLMLAFVGAALQSGQGVALAVCSESMVRRARTTIFQHLLRQDMSFFDMPAHSAGALSTLLTGRAADLDGLSGGSLGMLLVGASTIISGLIVAIAIGWKLGLVCTATAPVLLAAGHLRLSFLRKNEERTSKAYAAATTYATEACGCIRVVASLTLEDTVLRRYSATLTSQARKNAVSTCKASIFFALSQALVYCSFALCFWYGGRLMARGEYSMLQFFICYSTVIFGAQSAGNALSAAADTSKARAAARDFEAVAQMMPTIDVDDTKHGSSDPLPPPPIRGEIAFNNISHTYPTRASHGPSLTDITLHIPAGTFAAIVGPSGSGKSTLLALLERFYDPSTGSITLDATRDIRTLPLARLRQSIALVSQDTLLLSGTVRDNITLGLDTATASDAAIAAAAIAAAVADAALADVIASLPEGLDTHVGGLGGAALSGGQRQRVAIARALLRRPAVLLLDEATSALDTASERVVQDAVVRAARGRTTVAVAHRLSTVRDADRIFVMDAGRVVESGTHGELVARRGLYASMVAAQSLE
ncbi:abc multidrug transporter mdr1 [Diplodia corticola]|uniref:Abc multidrug transporter mdr1 n=1 Tax=Diplodia corticola TaxID=236234 RepID=A0A1J9QUG1_9PEZI|nr:abc multidrug transporter mdr1 [Diplodia corticola]OJD32606.1 abc multidrug transporter mdr1 [Diplodia corticola]